MNKYRLIQHIISFVAFAVNVGALAYNTYIGNTVGSVISALAICTIIVLSAKMGLWSKKT